MQPFDVERAKAGDLVCWAADGDVAKHVHFAGDYVIPVFDYSIEQKHAGIFTLEEAQHLLCMAPLAVVENRPVYRGDVLYAKDYVLDEVVAKDYQYTSFGETYLPVEGISPKANVELGKLSWKPWKTSGWMNINRIDGVLQGGVIYPTREEADKYSCLRINCIFVEVDREKV